MTEEFVSVLLKQSWVEADLTKGRLEAQGISAHLQGDADGPYPTGPTEVFVPSASEAQARRIIQEIGRGSYELADPGEDEAERAPKRD